MSFATDLRVPAYAGRRGFAVIPADTEELRDCVYRLRYYVYITVMNRKQIYADHSRRIIQEPLDESGVSYLAIKDGQMIGTVRRNHFGDLSTAYYSDFYKVSLFSKVRADRIAMTTKLMVLPQYQGTMTALQLISRYAAESYRLGVEIDLIDCNEHLVKFFERLGYFTHLGWSVHDEYGRVLPMFLALDAVRYLRSIRSPLAIQASKHVCDDQYGGYELIRRLARQPTLDLIRHAAIPFRQSPVDALAGADG